MDDIGCVVSMKSVETRLIFGNADLRRKWQYLSINIHGDMRVNMKGKLFLLITIDIVYGRILGVDNLWGLSLILRIISIDDISNKGAGDHHNCRNNTDDRNASCSLPALTFCFAAYLFFATFSSQVMLCRPTTDLFAHLECTNFQTRINME